MPSPCRPGQNAKNPKAAVPRHHCEMARFDCEDVIDRCSGCRRDFKMNNQDFAQIGSLDSFGTSILT